MALRDLLAQFRVDVDGKAVIAINQQLDKGAGLAARLGTGFDTLRKVWGAFAAAAGVGALTHITRQLLEEADALDDVSQALGITTQHLQQLEYATSFGGVSAEQLRGSLARLQRTIAGSEDSKELTASLKELGVTIKNQDGSFKTSGELFEAIGVALGEMTDSTKAAALNMQFFGKSAGGLMPLFKQGQEGIDRLKQEVEDLGAVYDKVFVEQSAEINDNIDKIKTAVKGFAIEAIGLLLPYLKALSDWLFKIAREIMLFVRSGERFRATVIALAVGLGGALLPTLIKLVPAILRIGTAMRTAMAPFLKFALIYLLLEDLVVFLMGGDSALGRLLDTMFGAGAAKSVVEALGKAWHAVGEFIQGVLPYLSEAWDWIANKIAQAWPMVKESAEYVLRWLGEEIKFYGNKLGEFAWWISNAIPAAWQAVKDAAGAALDWVGAKIDSVIARFTLVKDALGKLTSGDFAGAAAAYKMATDRSSPLAPTAPNNAGRRGVELVDQRSLTVQVSGATDPAGTARAVAPAVRGAMTADRQAIFDAVG